MTNSHRSADLLKSMRIEINHDLEMALDRMAFEKSPILNDMFRYQLGIGTTKKRQGKRVRPLFVLTACGATGGKWQQALPAASAVELIHNFSLIHDDIEDNSATRRGRATIWKKWGVPQAINTGDAMFALARLTTKNLRDDDFPPEITLDVHHMLDDACLQLTRGQHLDLVFESEERISTDQYLDMIFGKTAALFAAACAIGARLGGATDEIVQTYRAFGEYAGRAFQIIDDILGIWGVPEKTGKPVGDDLRSHKMTLPVIYALETSEEFANLWTSHNTENARITQMISLLDRIQAREYTQKYAEDYANLAKAAHNSSNHDSPEGIALWSLAEGLITRQS
jgi:geranylgeranyl diphosphate synthase type I